MNLSVKYLLVPYIAKLSGFCDIPYFPDKGCITPITSLLEVTVPPPSAEKIASLSIKAVLTLNSWNTFRLVSSAYSFCILPFAGSVALVISSAVEKTLVLFIPVLELNIPEYIKALNLVYPAGSSSTKYAFAP